MGLQSLQSKIKESLEQDTYTQKDVLYIIAQIYKYLERSQKNLGDPNDLKLKQDEYKTIKFFRNWALHAHKHSHDISEEILGLLKNISTGDNILIEKKLFTLLGDEIKKFYNKLINNKDIKLDNFFESLKEILSEQPIKLNNDEYVGYKYETMKLSKW